MKSTLTKYLRGLQSASPRICPTPWKLNESLPISMAGQRLGLHTLRPSLWPSRIEPENSASTSSISPRCSGPQHPLSTTGSLFSTVPFGIVSDVAGISCSQTKGSSATSNGTTFLQQVQLSRQLKKANPSRSPSGRVVIEEGASTPAEDGTRVSVHPLQGNADIDMSAPVAKEDMLSPPARAGNKEDRVELEGRGRFERRTGGEEEWREEECFAP